MTSSPLFSSCLPTIVLVGLMGAGKTSLGRLLSQRLKLSFADTDLEIEKMTGISIREMFETSGEASFRETEAEIITRLLHGPTCVLATGGGAFIQPVIRQAIKHRALSVWLKADLDLLVSRTQGRTHRPLLNHEDPRAILAGLIETRYPIYAQADITLTVRDEPVEQAETHLLHAIEAHVGYSLSVPENKTTPNHDPR